MNNKKFLKTCHINKTIYKHNFYWSVFALQTWNGCKTLY